MRTRRRAILLCGTIGEVIRMPGMLEEAITSASPAQEFNSSRFHLQFCNID